MWETHHELAIHSDKLRFGTPSILEKMDGTREFSCVYVNTSSRKYICVLNLKLIFLCFHIGNLVIRIGSKRGMTCPSPQFPHHCLRGHGRRASWERSHGPKGLRSSWRWCWETDGTLGDRVIGGTAFGRRKGKHELGCPDISGQNTSLKQVKINHTILQRWSILSQSIP